MTKKLKDPFADREKQKYERPLPSREFILMILEEAGCPISKKQLFAMLDINSDSDQDALSYRLKAMLRDGQMMQDRRGRFCLFDKINLIKGKVHAHPDGFGFFIPKDGGEDMVISGREMREVMHGDEVLAYLAGVDRRGRQEVKIHEVIERANATVVGRFFSELGIGFVVPDSKRLTQDIAIPMDMQNGAHNGQIVLVEIIAFPSKRNQAIGKIIHILGEHMAPGMETEVAILSHGIPTEWPEAVLTEVAKIKQQVSEEEISKRADLRNLPFVTIDGEDARDFDDAVFCKSKSHGGYQLYVAIADVSHYVKVGSALDKESQKRGNSVYFPGKVVPMLPEALSNGICSLNPNVDRLCMVVEMNISAEGKVTRSRFMRAAIHSRSRLTYTEVGNWLQEKPGVVDEHVWENISNLYNLFKILIKARLKRGAMEFNTTETKIEFDSNRKIKKIVPLTRGDAHRLIEECMLVANVTTAKFLLKAKLPSLYRVHKAPATEKILDLRQFLQEFGIKLGGGKQPTPKDFEKVLASIGSRPEKHLIEMVMLRSLKQAEYTEENDGHFGLAYAAYTHFTSPIRRYPDLLIHRAIGFLLDNQEDNKYSYSKEEISTLGRHCSYTERRADDATRDVVAWLKCEYMQDKLGQVFTGKISSVTGFGIFVELDEVYVEGLIHITSLGTDYYVFDELKHRLVGERSGKTYRLGDKMRVLVSRVDMDERKIDFELAEEL